MTTEQTLTIADYVQHMADSSREVLHVADTIEDEKKKLAILSQTEKIGDSLNKLLKLIQ
jgi:hypothetical protein